MASGDYNYPSLTYSGSSDPGTKALGAAVDEDHLVHQQTRHCLSLSSVGPSALCVLQLRRRSAAARSSWRNFSDVHSSSRASQVISAGGIGATRSTGLSWSRLVG